MSEENVITEIDGTLKVALEDPANVALGGEPVPVHVVTPDPDLVELVLPATTLQLFDIRRAPERTENEFEVEKNIPTGMATLRWPEAPYDLHYTVRGHAESGREDRLLLGQYLKFIDAHPILETQGGRKVYLSRGLTMRDFTRERRYDRALTFVVKARLPVGVEEEIPLALEHQIDVQCE